MTKRQKDNILKGKYEKKIPKQQIYNKKIHKSHIILERLKV